MRLLNARHLEYIQSGKPQQIAYVERYHWSAESPGPQARDAERIEFLAETTVSLIYCKYNQ